MVENSDKMWSTGEGNDKPLQYSSLENSMNSMKRQKGMTLKAGTPPVGRCPILLLEKSGEIAPEGMERLSQSGNNAQLWIYLVVNVKSDTIKNDIV